MSVPTPQSVRLAVPRSESAQLIRRLLERDLSRVNRELSELLADGYRKGDPQITDRLNRKKKVEVAIEEVRAIQSFWHLRRVQAERNSA